MPFFFFFPSKAFYVWSLPVWCLPFFGRFLLFCFFSLFADYELQTITCVVSSVTRFIADRAPGNRPGQTVQEAEKHPQIPHLSVGPEFGEGRVWPYQVTRRRRRRRRSSQFISSRTPESGIAPTTWGEHNFCVVGNVVLLGFVNRLFVYEIIALLRK